MSHRCDFQVKPSAKTQLFKCAGVDCLLISYVQSAGRQIAFVWSISLAIYSLSEKAVADWAEMRHGFIRPPLHFTPIPFAPYYAHRTVRARACLCVCVLGGIMFCFWGFVHGEKETVEAEEEEERWENEREGKERPYDAAITPHAGSICTLLFVSLLEKKQVIYQAWRGSWSLFPWHSGFVCLFVFECLSSMCKFDQYIYPDNRSFCLCAMTHLQQWTVAASPLK